MEFSHEIPTAADHNKKQDQDKYVTASLLKKSRKFLIWDRLWPVAFHVKEMMFPFELLIWWKYVFFFESFKCISKSIRTSYSTTTTYLKSEVLSSF